MKFSEDTLSVLKNFSQINPSVLFKPGNVIRTISPQKTVMASAVVSDTFDKPAGVYDLSRFHATLGLFTDPDIEFTENKFIIKANKSVVNYTYAAENMIVTPPEKEITYNEPTATVNLKWDDLTNVIRAASVLQLPEVAFVSDGTTISLNAVDKKNPTADKYNITLDDSVTSGVSFEMVIKVDNLKLMPGDYKVNLCSNGLAHFIGEKVQYWIAISV